VETRFWRSSVSSVDVYGGILRGVVLAEVERKQESQELILPPWIGKEVTGHSFYRKTNMRERALKAHQEHLARSDAVPA
jgi:CYTH domain-containing protein